jgi:hypothetical protein
MGNSSTSSSVVLSPLLIQPSGYEQDKSIQLLGHLPNVQYLTLFYHLSMIYQLHVPNFSTSNTLAALTVLRLDHRQLATNRHILLLSRLRESLKYNSLPKN